MSDDAISKDVVYSIADAFGRIGATLTPRQLYNRIEPSNRPHFTVLRDTVLPWMVLRGFISKSLAGTTKAPYTVYEWIGMT